MNSVSILRAIHEIYESHDGGTIRLTVEEEDTIVKLIQQGQNLPMHSVSVSDFVDSEHQRAGENYEESDKDGDKALSQYYWGRLLAFGELKRLLKSNSR